jgi:tetratricopeptide (TPR) repeat protein
MQVDARRDHSFTIPRPDLSLRLGVPNACVGCHTGKDNQWANSVTQSWGAKANDDHWAHLLARAQKNDVSVTRSSVEAIANNQLPAFIRASLLRHLAPMPSRVSAEIATQSLQDENSLVRRAAAQALQGHPAQLRWQVLSPYLNDKSRSVRTQIAESLLDVYSQLPVAEQPRLLNLLNEYREALSLSADSVTTQLSIAHMETQLGDLVAAEKAYHQALMIEPAFVPALLNLANFYRLTERTQEEAPLLQRALAIAPDSAAVQHSIGLYHVRATDYAVALEHLKLATKQSDALPYYSYVYSVALENQGRLSEAIDELKVADEKWPNQYEVLMTLVLYLEKSGKSELVLPYLSKLSAIAPSAPAVQQLLNKYQTK